MTWQAASGAFSRVKFALRGLIRSFPLNAKMLKDRRDGYKNLVFHIGASTQLMHVEDVLGELMGRAQKTKLSIFLLTKPSEKAYAQVKIKSITPGVQIYEDSVVRFLLFCDFYSAVDQGEVFPIFRCRYRACSFHGQPSKGNVYQRFNYRQINILFFYGPLMRNHYLRNRDSNPSWPKIPYFEVGQPLSDRRLNQRTDKAEARERLGLDPLHFTILYAPSFEYCSSLATHGELIIDTLLSLGVNLIVRPHPAFYNKSVFTDVFNADIPTADSWDDRITTFTNRRGCLFPRENTLDAGLSIWASDVMVTDFSGVAFDGILQDLGMIYWDCPRVFDEYLPRRYGINGLEALADLACNVGREAGIVVKNENELVNAVESYRGDPGILAGMRQKIRQELLFNPGKATVTMADKIQELVSTEK